MKDGKPLIHVAAGVLTRPGGEVLFAQRPQGKIAAGYWEFPGGKIEPGETALAALVRELEEELGVQVQQARPLIRFRHEYSNRSVVLDTWQVDVFAGQVQSREAQAFTWVQPAQLAAWPQALPTVAPIAAALCLPQHYVFTPLDRDLAQLRAGLAALPAGALLRLRRPELTNADYNALARKLIPAAQGAGLKVVLDRNPQQALDLGADGWHATANVLRTLTALPEAPLRCFASCHSRSELMHASALGFSAAVLGAVQATPTHPEQRPLGWDGFAEQVDQAGLPVYAIGGVGPAQCAQAFAAYGQGVAGISAYWPELPGSGD